MALVFMVVVIIFSVRVLVVEVSGGGDGGCSRCNTTVYSTRNVGRANQLLLVIV